MATTADPRKPQGVTQEDDEQAGIVHDARGALARNARLLKEIAALETTLKRRHRPLASPKH